jgi:hypothetical protein
LGGEGVNLFVLFQEANHTSTRFIIGGGCLSQVVLSIVRIAGMELVLASVVLAKVAAIFDLAEYFLPLHFQRNCQSESILAMNSKRISHWLFG